jgi:hypothetical protein
MAFTRSPFPMQAGTSSALKAKEDTGPVDKKQLKLQKSEHKDTYVEESKRRNSRISGLEDRLSFIKEDIGNQDGKATEQQKKDMAKIKQEIAILRKTKHEMPK